MSPDAAPTPPPAQHGGGAQIARRAAVAVLAAAVLLGVFALYVQPEFVRTLADQVWACF